MNDSQTIETTSDGHTSRRVMLRRMSSFGLLAAAGAGFSSLLGASSARADNSGPLLPGVQTVKAGPDCNACVTCVRDEYTCYPGGCGPGNCCYHCTGCGHNYHSCYNVNCNVLRFTTCYP